MEALLPKNPRMDLQALLQKKPNFPKEPNKLPIPAKKPSYGSPNSSSQEIKIPPRPTGNFDQNAARSLKQKESKALFQKSNPAPTYRDVTGTERKIDFNSESVKQIRNTTPEKIQTHTVRVEHHYHDLYGNKYDTWRSRPVVHVGGGYSPIFWYMMMDSWNAQRRAEWAYHNWAVLDTQRRNELMANAEFAHCYKNISGPVNPNYIDPEFVENPDLMYTNDYVQSAYGNLSPLSVNVLLWTFTIVCVCLALVFLWWLVFKKVWDA